MAARPRLAVRRASVFVLAAAVGLVLPPSAAPWGFTAHRLVNRKAIATLPEPLRSVFENNLDYVTERAIDPDLQRSGPGDPDHFLDMDAFGAYPFDAIPSVESEYRARFGKEAQEGGRVPWKVAEEYARLIEAFRSRDVPGALARAGALAHFVADAHVPLHATRNHDGQLTGQKGVHSRWESELVERYLRQLEPEVLPGAAQIVDDPQALIFRTLRESYLHSLEVLASDAQSAGPRDLAETAEDDRYDDAYYSRMYERERTRLVARLSASATAAGSLWLSAWERAGRPTLDPGYRVPYVRHATRAVLLSLDGSAASVLDDAVARGVMPALASLRKRGATATSALTTLPAKTAAGHAALYTGAWSDRNGVTDNDAAVPGGAVTETGDGYSSLALRAEPLWAAAARQDIDVAVVSATQVWPFGTYFDEHRFPGYYGRHLTLFDGYQNATAADRVFSAADLHLRAAGEWLGPLPAHEGEVREVEIHDLGLTIDGLLYDDPGDPARGFDTLYLGLDRDPAGGITLKPAPPREDASAFAALLAPLAGGEAPLYFRLFELSPDGTQLVLYRAGACVLRSSKPRLDASSLEVSGGFVGNGGGHAYRAGLLGPPLWKGGDGAAEGRYLETIALVIRQIERVDFFVIDRCAWELLFAYLPYPDEALHEWYGHLDPARPGRDPVLAARLQPSLDRMLHLVDDHLGRLATHLGEGVVLAIAGDHGVVGVDRTVRPNVALASAGLLAFDAKGAVDLSRTQAVYGPGNFVLINKAARRGGTVRPEDEEPVRRRVTEALLAIRDPETRGKVVLSVMEPGRPGAEPAFGGAAGGDLYLSAAPRYFVARQLHGALVEPMNPTGEHFIDPERPSMRPGFVIVGPGVAGGASLGTIREIDVAPTLAALLGIEPPAQATGKVLEAALARKQPRPPSR